MAAKEPRKESMAGRRDLHVIVLAGQENSELDHLTRALSGTSLPKQFAFLAGDGSLLQQVVTSFAARVPLDRITVVVPTALADLARAQLRAWRGIGILARPLDRGFASDVLLVLGKLATRAPDATVVMVPAHHYVPGADTLVGALMAAESALATIPVVLAGAAMSRGLAGDSLVVPGPPLDGGVLSVHRFAQVTSPAQARRLKLAGALWDTSTFTGRVRDLWGMAERELPKATRLLRGLWSEKAPSAAAMAAALRALPGSRQERAFWQEPGALGVVPVHGSGWNAWCSSEQLMESLDDPLDLERLLSRIYQRQHGLTRAQLKRRFRSEARARAGSDVCFPR